MALDRKSEIAYPLARSERLIVQSVGDETVIYDEDSQASHALAPLAAAVYAYADGKNSTEEIAELAAYRLNAAVTTDDVNAAVAQLESCGLLQEPEATRAGFLQNGITRRTALKTFGAAGAGAMLITSIAAPLASAATDTLVGYGAPYLCGTGTNTITDQSGYSKVSGSKAKNGWVQPYVGSGNSYQFVGKGKAGAPWANGGTPAASDYVLGATCIAAVNSSGGVSAYGDYQVVPCDGGTGNYPRLDYACAEVVCVPTTDGKLPNGKSGSLSNLTSVAGAITSGSILPASDSCDNLGTSGGYGPGVYYNAAYCYINYPFKFCCGDGTSNTCALTS